MAKFAKKKARPTYNTTKESRQLTMHEFVSIVDAVAKTKKLGKLKNAVKGKKTATVTLAPKTINQLKKFFFDNKLHKSSKIGRLVVNERPAEGDPDDCKLGTGSNASG